MGSLNDSKRGFPGNQLLIDEPGSTSVHLMDWRVGFRRPVKAISSNAYQVSTGQSGTVFTYGGLSSGIVITFPKPKKGLWYEIQATGAIATAVTKIACLSSGAFVRGGDSGGCDALVSEATTCEFGAAGGLYLELIGLSTSQYLARQWVSGASVASTAQWKASS